MNGPAKRQSTPDFRQVTIDGERLRTARIDAGLRQEELAGLLKLSAATLSRLETNRLTTAPTRDADLFDRLTRHIRRLGGVPHDYLRPRFRDELEVQAARADFRNDFFNDESSTWPATQERLKHLVGLSLSLMDANGALLAGRAGEEPRQRETRRLMRLEVCKSFRGSIQESDSPVHLVEEQGNAPIHPCNAHDSSLIRSAFALGHVALSRCPSGILSAIIPFRVVETMRWAKLELDEDTRRALDLVNFSFAVPAAQMAYRAPDGDDAQIAHDLRDFFLDIRVHSSLFAAVTPDRVGKIRKRLLAQGRVDIVDAPEIQQRSLATHAYLTGDTSLAPTLHVPWGGFWDHPASEALDRWVDYQLECLLMADPLMSSDVNSRNKDQVWSVIDSTDEGDSLRELDRNLRFSLRWLAEKHHLPARDILLSSLKNFPSHNPSRRMHLDGFGGAIKNVRLAVSEWFLRDFPRWLATESKSGSLLAPLSRLLERET